MLKLNTPLLAGRGTPDTTTHYCQNTITADNNIFITDLIATGGVLPLHPPFEIHPYKSIQTLQGYDKYIIGTFPPISYILDHPDVLAAVITELHQPVHGGRVIYRPGIPFYHGNKGSMWNFILSQEELATLANFASDPVDRQGAKNFLMAILEANEINYSDIIDSCQRELDGFRYTADDRSLHNLCVNMSLIEDILGNPNASTMLFNTGSTFSNRGLKFQNGSLNVDSTAAFDVFAKKCLDLGLELSVRIQRGLPKTHFTWTELSNLTDAQKKNKVAFELRIKNPLDRSITGFSAGAEKVLTVVTPFSPAAVGRGRLKQNLCVLDWLLLNLQLTPRDLLTQIYHNFRNGLLTPIYSLNR